ncbi:MAG: ATPase, T2SS/T4P/T4SS family [Candidatus Shapirobacteria bacterium]
MKRPADERLYQLLLPSKFIDPKALDEAYKSSQELEKPLADTLVFRGLISEEALGQLLADSLKVPFVSLKNRLISDELLALVPQNVAKYYHLIPFDKTGEDLKVALADPANFEAIETLRRRTGLNVIPYFASQSDLARALNQYRRDITKNFAAIINENIKKASPVKNEADLEKLLAVATDLPIVKILNALLEYAAAENASDLHLESLADSLMVRLRLDGKLKDILTLPKDIQPSLIARLKVLSNLKIDEHRIPQDGRFKFQMDETVIALRVSIIPAFLGESAVLRLLPESARPLSLEELGLTPKNMEKIKRNIDRPHGLILVTGPTGCGKTTTLYSILNILNTIEVKICTVEDPVEYSINRVNQIQINPKTGLDFATGLRALLRHDPDIIMVGEIRDRETLNTAIHSALTGHLVLSTLHTNDAVSTIARLLDMGAEDYLVASTLNLIIAQRLVRKICSSCIEEFRPPAPVIEKLEIINQKKLGPQKFYHGRGCDKCRQSGYRGRIGIYEVLETSENLRQLIVKKCPADELKHEAVKEGMGTMFQDGLDKIGAGLTTIEEVITAVRD